jgi:hypothetical protein
MFFLYAASSSILAGLQRDARYVVEQIVARPQQLTVREREHHVLQT